jgi:2-iminobutanoate/2-iminopropanoate deaminase
MKYRRIPLLFALALLPGCAADPAPPEATAPDAQNAPVAPERSYINSRSAQDPDVPPFSGGVMVGNTFYVAGTIGLLPDQTVPETAQEEARIVLTNVRNTLEAAGLTMDDLVSVQVYSSDVADYDAFNEVYRTFFTQEYPARAYLGSGTLLFEARFEVLGFAVKR